METSKCLLCNQDLDTTNDHYRDLVCSFGNCPGHGYHEGCIERYLRKKGHGPEQKTGYPCPATLDNGKLCSGTIKKTHMKTPTNEKKKQQSRQAAVAVNNMANAARFGAPTKGPAAGVIPKPGAALRPKNPPTVAKVVDASHVRAHLIRSGQRSVMESDDQEQPARPALPLLGDFMFTPKSRKGTNGLHVDQPNADDAGREDGHKQSAVWRNRIDQDEVSVKLRPASTVSKNAAMAPEPVTRQRIVPGSSAPSGTSAKLSKDEQRARVVAWRAEMKCNSSARVLTAPSATGLDGAAAPATGLAATSTGIKVIAPKPPLPQPSNAGLGAADSLPLPYDSDTSAPTTPALRDDHAAFAPLAGNPTTDPSGSAAALKAATSAVFNFTEDDFPEMPLSRSETSSAFWTQQPSGQPSTPPAEPEPLASGQQSPLAASTVDDETDPIVLYDMLFFGEDDSRIVLDAANNYRPLEEVYGANAEIMECEVAPGDSRWFVVVRQSFYTAADIGPSVGLSAAASLAPTDSGLMHTMSGLAFGDGAGGESVGVVGVVRLGQSALLPGAAAGVCSTAVTADFQMGVEAAAYGGMAGSFGFGQATPPQVAGYGDESLLNEEDFDESFDEILSLCLGKA